MNEVEYRWDASYICKYCRVLLRRCFQIGRFHRHGVNLFGRQRDMLEQAFAQMGKIAIRMSGWSDPFVDLYNVNLIPRDILFGQSAEHDPRGVAAADRDERPCFSGYRICVYKYFNFHENISNVD